MHIVASKYEGRFRNDLKFLLLKVSDGT